MTIPRFTYTLFGLAALALLCYCYYATAIGFDSRWNTRHEAYSHGYMLLGLCGLLVARQLPSLRDSNQSPYWPAIIPLIGFSVVWLFGEVSHVLVLKQLALPAIGLLCITAIYGLNTGKSLRFPFLLFYAAVPIWDIFNGILQAMTVRVCTLGLEFVGIPVYIEQNQITIPAGTFQVAGGCSGLNYLLMIGTIGAVYGHLYYRLFWHKILLLALALVFGLLCNWLRVFSLVIVGHTSDMQSAQLGDHEIMGWITFSICLVPYLYLATHIETLDKILQPRATTSGIPSSPRAYWFVIAVIATAAANLGPILHTAINLPTPHGTLANSLSHGQHTLISYAKQPHWQPAYKNIDEYLVLQFPAKHPELQVHIATYFSQQQGKELIQWGNQLIDEKKWRLESVQSIHSSGGDKLNLATLKSTTGTAEIIYWYAVGDYSTHSAIEAKLYQLLAFLRGREDASLIAVFYPCPQQDCPGARSDAITTASAIKQLYRNAMITAISGNSHTAQ